MIPLGILHDDAVTIIVEEGTGLPDDDGVPQYATREVEWAGVNVQQINTDETPDPGEREGVVTRWRVAGAIPATIPEEGDRIRWRGQEYEVDGEPDVRAGAYRIEHAALTMVKAKG